MNEGPQAVLQSREPPQEEAVWGVCLLSFGFSPGPALSQGILTPVRLAGWFPKSHPCRGGSSSPRKVKWPRQPGPVDLSHPLFLLFPGWWQNWALAAWRGRACAQGHWEGLGLIC